MNDQVRYIRLWLILCNLSIFFMIIVGAITRLTESGLSITQWKPLIGAIPPLNQSEWMHVFDLYKQTPEFQKKNFWMGLDDFKVIFFWEWFHRLWGRLIGVIFALPFFYFMLRGWIPKQYRLRLVFIFFLGALQGFMGWYMVQSGLIDKPAVSHYRLAAHLLLALFIYANIFWLILDLGRQKPNKTDINIIKPSAYILGWMSLLSLVVTICWGAFTAGLDAGLVYNQTFPKMGENWIPSEVWFHKPLWLNFFENHAGVQFVHRWLAMITTGLIVTYCILAMRQNPNAVSFKLTLGFVLIQLTLGILTLFSGVNIVLAVLHQAGAVCLLSVMLWNVHDSRI